MVSFSWWWWWCFFHIRLLWEVINTEASDSVDMADDKG
jgi:hypothetical protein